MILVNNPSFYDGGVTVVEGFLQVGYEVAANSRFYNDVIDIDLRIAPYSLFEAKMQTSLVSSPHVLQSKWHFHIEKIAEEGDEHGGGLVCLCEGYLVITWVSIQKT
jgi:hypothetical protein